MQDFRRLPENVSEWCQPESLKTDKKEGKWGFVHSFGSPTDLPRGEAFVLCSL